MATDQGQSGKQGNARASEMSKESQQNEVEQVNAPKPTALRDIALLSLAALGVVYGDLGTSPLYALRACFNDQNAVKPTPENVYGILSLIFWALMISVTLKYVVFVMRADNHGEGGILMLTTLVAPVQDLFARKGRWLIFLGLFGAAFLYGDGVITPAVSVLSAVEGLKVAAPSFEPFVLPLTIGILIALFLLQSRGTGSIGKIFGPVMLAWFVIQAILGGLQLAQDPAVLTAINPIHAIKFMAINGFAGFLILGTVVLAVTGCEALYADMGHFGRRPIQVAWFAVVLPSLVLNYFGQGAMIIHQPGSSEHPFFQMAPGWALIPLVILATVATVIASQSIISGAFSLTMQATQEGVLPRLRILHTSATTFGQIYIPMVNWLLMVACVLVVVGFRSSTSLTGAYGVAVTGTMAITTLLFYHYMRGRMHWGALKAGLLSALFFVSDWAFFASNLFKIPQGGWLPLTLAALVFFVMVTWQDGRRLLTEHLQQRKTTLEGLIKRFKARPPNRVPGTAVYLTSNPLGTPLALAANLDHFHVLHDNIIVTTIKTENVSQVPQDKRIHLEMLDKGMYRLTITYGYLQEQNVPEIIKTLQIKDIKIDPSQVTYFVTRTRVIPTDVPGMAPYREKIFTLLSRNAATMADYFCLPPNQVVEIGTKVEI